MSGFMPGMHAHMVSLLGNPDTDTQKWVLLAACMIALFAGLDRVSSWLGAPLKGPGGAAGAAVIGSLLFLAGLQLATAFVPPDIQAREGMFRALTLTAVTAGVVAPVTARLYASSWGKAMAAWLLSAALAAGALAITHAAMGAAWTGESNTQKFLDEPDL